MDPVENHVGGRPPWQPLYTLSAAAALVAALLLLAGLLGVLASLPSGGTSGWAAAVPDNWLAVIFKMHAGFSGAHLGLLQGPDLLDIAILALVGITCLGLDVILGRTSRIWSVVAVIQPFLGIGLFLATQTAGRSAAMGAVLVISFVMLRSNIFRRATAYLGIVASTFLLVGDFSAGVAPSVVLAVLFGIAYLLFIAWFVIVARSLWQLAVGAP